MSTVEESRSLRSRRPGSRVRPMLEEVGQSSTTHSLILTLYAISVVSPVRLQLGIAYLTMSRILLLALLIPMLVRLFSGRYGGVKLPDYFMIFYCFWAFLALSANHGIVESVEFSVMFFVETVGAYLVGRIYIRSRADLRHFIKWLLIIVLISLPFTVAELGTGYPVIIETIRNSNPIPDIISVPQNVNYPQRLGMDRAQFTFGHPILYGVLCSSLMALAITVHTQESGLFAKTFWGMVSAVGTFASLTSAAFLSAILQLGFLGFDRVTRLIKARWKLLVLAIVLAYFAIDLVSNRSPIVVFVSTFSFSSATAYNRILIFEYGSAEVLRHPFFGIGNNDWTRPEWMVASVDNHWLLQTMRYGLPAGIFLIGSVLWVLIKIGRSKINPENVDLFTARRGYMAALLGWCIALGTVAINVEVNSYFLTLLASGIWIIDTALNPDNNEEPDGTRHARRTGGGRRHLPKRKSKTLNRAHQTRRKPMRNR